MKRILLACFLLTATCTFVTTQHASAQTAVTQASFTTQVNQLNSDITAGNAAAAQTDWTTVHNSMLQVLATTKSSIANAATPADKTTYTNIITNQISIYQTIWPLHTDLTLNQAAIINKLQQFDATIY